MEISGHVEDALRSASDDLISCGHEPGASPHDTEIAFSYDFWPPSSDSAELVVTHRGEQVGPTRVFPRPAMWGLW